MNQPKTLARERRLDDLNLQFDEDSGVFTGMSEVHGRIPFLQIADYKKSEDGNELATQLAEQGGDHPKIFVYINSGYGTDWTMGQAMAEDGHVLAGHCSSSTGFFRHDMGLNSNWKHEAYRKHYPNGYQLIALEKPEEVLAHEGLQAAYKLNQALGEAAKKEAEECGPKIVIEFATKEESK